MPDDEDAEFIANIAREAEDPDAQVREAIRQAGQLARRYREPVATPPPPSPLDAGTAELLAQTLQLARVMNVTEALRDRDVAASQAGFEVVQAARIMSRIESGQATTLARQIAADPRNAAVLDQVSSTVRRAGAADLSPGVLLLVVLVYLIAIGLPATLPELPAGVQTVVLGELASVGLALAVTGLLIPSLRAARSAPVVRRGLAASPAPYLGPQRRGRVVVT